jgi:hypothetical protein
MAVHDQKHRQSGRETKQKDHEKPGRTAVAGAYHSHVLRRPALRYPPAQKDCGKDRNRKSTCNRDKKLTHSGMIRFAPDKF